MDDRTWYLAIGTLIAAVVAIFVDAALSSFNVPAGFWAVLSGVLTFLGLRGRFKSQHDEDERGS